MKCRCTGVSVIVPTYNREQYIKECLDSILAQEYNGPLEIVVCDDGSTDKTLEIAESYGPPVVVLRKPEDCKDQGPGPTRNRGLLASTKPLIAFLDSDDIYSPGHLERLATMLDKNKDLGLVFDDLYGMSSEGTHTWKRPYPIENIESPYALLIDGFLTPNPIMFRREVLASVGEAFDESLLMAEDIDLILRIMEKYPVQYIPGKGALLREHDGRMTKSSKALRKSYYYANLVLEKAIKRYPYPKKLIQKRRAVIHYRLGTADLQEKKYFAMIYHFLMALFYDPRRALRVLFKE